MGQIEDNGYTIKDDGTIVRNKIENLKKKIVEKETESVKKESAGLAELIVSFLFPLIGVICYFIRKNKVDNASAYLYSALGGFVLSFILSVIIG